MSWSASAASNSISGANTNEELNKIRDDNSYLAKQHQQLMLANLLIKAPKLDEQLEANTTGCFEHHPQQHLLLGRSGEQFANQSGNTNNNLVMSLSGNTHRRHPLQTSRIKRRRSIGSSTAVPIELQTRSELQEGCLIGAKLDANQRAKSRSQTTIHYDQRQDPFETVPFSYLNSGYLSDSPAATSQRLYKSSPSGATNSYGATQNMDNMTYITNSECQPVESQGIRPSMVASVRPGIIRPQHRWSNIKPTYVPPPQAEVIQLSSHTNQSPQQQLSSQFDPQNSRQLIDLIQQKHRQQIAQANRTAATIQELQRQPNLNQQRQNVVGSQQPVGGWR